MLDEKSDGDSVKWLSEITEADERSVGIEGVNIAKLYQKKILVPPGFVLSKEVCMNFIKDNGIEPRIKAQILHLDKNNEKKVISSAENIKEIIESSVFKGSIIEEIDEAYGFLDTSNIYSNNKKLKVSVKSLVGGKSLEAEDKTSLIKSIVQIYSEAMGNKEWVKNCDEKNIEESLPVIAVYKSVNENVSAFVYSRNPENTKEMLVEALNGSDKYFLDRNLEKLNVRKNVFDEKKGFDDYSLKRMALYAEEIENIFNCPQKIEFSVGDKGLNILSSSPLYIESNSDEKEEEKKMEETPSVLQNLDSIVDNQLEKNIEEITQEDYEKPDTLGKFFKNMENEERPDVMEKIFGDNDSISNENKNYEELVLEALN